MKIAIASDHAGFALKGLVLAQCEGLGHEVRDLGPASADRVDYPDYAHRVAEAVAAGDVERGILVCGSGIGMSIAANRHARVRAVVAVQPLQATMARAHNDANVLCLGARFVDASVAESIVMAFLDGPFEGGRHAPRVEKIERSDAVSDAEE